VKLGYNKLCDNKLGYYEHSVKTNKIFSPKWTLYNVNQPGYNKPHLKQTNLAVCNNRIWLTLIKSVKFQDISKLSGVVLVGIKNMCPRQKKLK